MIGRAAIHRKYLEEIKTEGLFPSLSEGWGLFEQQLPSLLEECQLRTQGLPQMRVWVNSANLTDESQITNFSTFLAVLKECFRQGL